MTHTFKKVALFAAVVSVAATQTAAKDVLAKLDGFVTVDTAPGAVINVALQLANCYVNGSYAAKGAKGKLAAHFVPTFRVPGSKDVVVKLNEVVPADVTEAMLADAGLVRNAEKKAEGKAKTHVIAKAKSDATFTAEAAKPESAKGKSDGVSAVVIAIGENVDPKYETALTALGFKIDAGKLAIADDEVTVEDVPAATGDKTIAVKTSAFELKQTSKGALNFVATVYLVASIANTVRHLMAKKADQVSDEEVVDAEQTEEAAA